MKHDTNKTILYRRKLKKQFKIRLLYRQIFIILPTVNLELIVVIIIFYKHNYNIDINYIQYAKNYKHLTKYK